MFEKAHTLQDVPNVCSDTKGRFKKIHFRGKSKRVHVPVIRVHEKDGHEFKEGVKAIREIVEKKIDLSLFDQNTPNDYTVVDTLIRNSGGVIRDLFEMIEMSANSADYLKASKISHEHVKYALARLKSEYRGMITIFDETKSALTTDQLYEKLIEIAKSSSKEFCIDEAMFFLLSCMAVLEYNDEEWFDVHPAVKSLLRDMGDLSEDDEELKL